MISIQKNKAVIFLDVDGTLVDADGNIPPSASFAISEAQKNGHICVINTGRPFSHVVPSVKALGTKGYICSCGQYISIDGNIKQHEVFTTGESQFIIAKAKECRVDLFIESEAGLFHSFVHPMSERTKAEFERFRRRGFDVDADVENDSFFFSKICAWEYEDSRMADFLSAVSPYMYVIRKEGRMYELVKLGCSKALGIRAFIDHCGLSDYETFAVGDSGNDAEMLSAVEHGIAMGNAQPSLKEIAEHVTASLSDDGLYKAFLHYGLI